MMCAGLATRHKPLAAKRVTRRCVGPRLAHLSFFGQAEPVSISVLFFVVLPVRGFERGLGEASEESSGGRLVGLCNQIRQPGYKHSSNKAL